MHVTSIFRVKDRRETQQACAERKYVFAKPHGFITKKTGTGIFTAVRNKNYK
jgi:hypothetical protein